MKKRRVIWSDRANNTLADIVAYISQDNPAAAQKVLDMITAAANKLVDFSTGRRGRVSGTYEKPLHRIPYILVYECISTAGGGEYILILHVIHTARDWDTDRWPEE